MYKVTVLLDALDYISLGSVFLQLADEEKHTYYCNCSIITDGNYSATLIFLFLLNTQKIIVRRFRVSNFVIF